MSDFYKYYREEHLQFIDMYKSYYCISTNNECSVIQTLLTYYKKDNCYDLLISQSFNFDPKTSNENLQKVDFDNDIKMFEDLENSIKKANNIDTNNIIVYAESLKTIPNIAINYKNNSLVYTPKKQTIFFMSRYALNMKLRNEDYYIREYSDILQAFNDPIFKNYVDVLNEI